jgi:hypothetical protein
MIGPDEATWYDLEDAQSAVMAAAEDHGPGSKEAADAQRAYLATEDAYMGSQVRRAEALEAEWSSPDFATPEEEADAHWEAGQEAMYGTEAEQAEDAALDEAEKIISAEWGQYMTDTCIIPGPEPEAEA